MRRASSTVAGVHDTWRYVHQCVGRLLVWAVGDLLCDCMRQHARRWAQLLAS